MNTGKGHIFSLIIVYNVYGGFVMPRKVIALLAEGFEEVEAVTSVDYLRRAGVEVTVAAVGKSLNITGSHGIEIKADASLDGLLGEGKLSASQWDGVFCPGGLPGADNLAASREAGAFLREMAGAGKWVCAICAAPARVLSPLGILSGKNFTCFPGEEEKVLALGSSGAGAVWKKDRVVIDGNVITSQGAGTAGEFACAIIGKLVNEAEAKKIAEKVLMPPAAE
jgi:4-methyl-5(b-hydroxyethyl)-thiazole monophosphate biosynthesis